MEWYVPFEAPLLMVNEVVNRWWVCRYTPHFGMLGVGYYIIPGDPIVLPTFRHLVDEEWSSATVFIFGQNEQLELVSEITIRCKPSNK